MIDPELEEVVRLANELRDVRGMDPAARRILTGLLLRAFSRVSPDAAAAVAGEVRADLRKVIRSDL